MGWTTRIAQTTNFLAVRKSWLGEGGHAVPDELAQARADVCTNGFTDKDGKPCKCPCNYRGDWIWGMATQLAINAQSKLRRIMNLKVNGEENLGICDACGCKLKLKVHVPIDHIYSHTTPEQLKKYPEKCWIRKETNH